MTYSLKQLADILDAKIIGDAELLINAVAPIEEAKAGDISFVQSSKYVSALRTTSASAVLIKEDMQNDLSVAGLIVNNPRAAYAKVVSLMYPEYQPGSSIHSSAVIHDTAHIGDNVFIGAHVVVEANAQINDNVRIDAGTVVGRESIIGKGTHLYSNVTVYHGCSLGENCIIHSATVIGADGFGFEFDQNEWLKVPQVGGVAIGNNVEIGACSAVDRGALKDTIIENGVKLDNHVQIAHNCFIGENTIMSRGVGIAGSTRIGKNCIFGGMTGVRDNIEIVDGVTVQAMTIVSKSLTKPGIYASTTPIDDVQSWRKNSVRFRQLDDMAKRIRQLEKQIEKKN